MKIWYHLLDLDNKMSGILFWDTVYMYTQNELPVIDLQTLV